MRWFAAVLAGLFLVASGAQAAQYITGPQGKSFTSAPVACAYGTAYPDGCPAAFSDSTLKNALSPGLYSILSGQTWAVSLGNHPMPFNLPWFDYAVGPSAAHYLGTDPAPGLVSGIPNCSYVASGGPAGGNGQRLSCNTAGVNYDIEGYDFSLHGCLLLQFGTAVTGTVTIKHNHFAMGTNCQGSGGSGGELVQIVGNPSLTSFDMENNEFDGGDRAGYTGCSGGLCTFDPNEAFVGGQAAGTFTEAYNGFHDFTGRPLTTGGASTAAYVSQYSYAWNVCQGVANHCEFEELIIPNNVTVTSVTERYLSLIGATTQIGGSGTAWLDVGPGSGSGQTFTSWTIDGVFAVANLYSGASGGRASTTGSSLSGGTLTVGSISSGTISIGQGLSGINPPGIGNPCYTSAGSGLSWTVTGTGANCQGTIGPGQVYLSSGNFSALVSTNRAAFGTLTIHNSYFDGYGADSGAFGGTGVGVCFNKTSSTGTITTFDTGSGGTPASGGNQNTSLRTGLAISNTFGTTEC